MVIRGSKVSRQGQQWQSSLEPGVAVMDIRGSLVLEPGVAVMDIRGSLVSNQVQVSRSGVVYSLSRGSSGDQGQSSFWPGAAVMEIRVSQVQLGAAVMEIRVSQVQLGAAVMEIRGSQDQPGPAVIEIKGNQVSKQWRSGVVKSLARDSCDGDQGQSSLSRGKWISAVVKSLTMGSSDGGQGQSNFQPGAAVEIRGSHLQPGVAVMEISGNQVQPGAAVMEIMVSLVYSQVQEWRSGVVQS